MLLNTYALSRVNIQLYELITVITVDLYIARLNNKPQTC